MKNSRILVVDDEEGIRYSFCKYLGDGGYNVVSAQSYKEALKKITQSEFDLIFTDIVLGGKTGTDLLGKVKEMKLFCPVVIFS